MGTDILNRHTYLHILKTQKKERYLSISSPAEVSHVTGSGMFLQKHIIDI